MLSVGVMYYRFKNGISDYGHETVLYSDSLVTDKLTISDDTFNIKHVAAKLNI